MKELLELCGKRRCNTKDEDHNGLVMHLAPFRAVGSPSWNWHIANNGPKEIKRDRLICSTLYFLWDSSMPWLSSHTHYTIRPLMFFLTNQLKHLLRYTPGRLKTRNGDLSACFSPFRKKSLRFLETIFKRLFLSTPFPMTQLLLLD